MKKLSASEWIRSVCEQRSRRHRRPQEVARQSEICEPRALLAATLFDPVTGSLTVNQEASDSRVELGADGAGNVTVNGVVVQDGLGSDLRAASVTSIVVNGTTKNDRIDLSNVGGSAFSAISGQSVTINGGDGNDTLFGSMFSDAIFGDGDKDFIRGFGGDDLLRGGEGRDVLQGDAGDDRLIGDQSADTLAGGTGNDTIDGSGGDDSIDGEDGSDVLRGGTSNDTINGGTGNDYLNGDSERDSLMGDDGDDSIFGGDSNDFLSGGSGNDVLDGENGNDTVSGGDGNDIVAGSADRNGLFGDAGDDSIYGGDSHDTVFGGDGADFVSAGRGNDIVYGGSGDDTIETAQGSDEVYGEDGDDIIRGQGGSDLLSGGDGRDTLMGNSGSDTMIGGPGNDALIGSDENDLIEITSEGTSLFVDDFSVTTDGVREEIRKISRLLVRGTSASELINLSGFSGPATVTGGGGHDTIVGTDQADEIATLDGRDLISGGGGNDLISGGAGSDTLNGDAGNDTLNGEDGDDLLIGGDGSDRLEGALGGDILDGVDGEPDTLLGGPGADYLKTVEGQDSVDAGSDGGFLQVGTVLSPLSGPSVVQTYAVDTIDELKQLPGVPSVGLVYATVSETGRGGRFVYDATMPSQPVDDALTLSSASGGRWLRSVTDSEVINVDWFGAKGDGVTDDSVAINRALLLSGDGATIEFTAGKTYLINQMLNFEAGQTLTGYGATIKRGDEIRTTTSTPIETGDGSRVLTVASTVGFRVGMTVAVADADGPELKTHTILAIDGNQMTLGGNWRKSSVSGASIVTAFHMISRLPDPNLPRVEDVHILGLTLDGNAAGNTTVNSWRLSDAIRFNSTNGVIRDVTVLNSQSEAITANADNVLVENVLVDGAQGNGIHLSGGVGIIVRNNVVRHTNLGGPSLGHVGGAIAYSLNCENSIITGNLFEYAKAGIGDFNSEGGNGALITGNTIRNVENAFDGYNISSSFENADLIFQGNTIVDSGPVIFGDQSTVKFESGPNRVQFLDNNFVNSGAFIEDAQNITFSGNTWTTNDNAEPVIHIHNSRGITIDDTINGGLIGVKVTGSDTRDVTISGAIQNQRQNGVLFEQSLGAEFSGIIDGALIVGSPSASANYVAVQTLNGVTVRDSHLSVPRGRAAVFLYDDGSPAAGTIIEDTFILSDVSVPSIEIAAGVIGQTIRNNFLQRSIVNPNVSGNSITGNVRLQ